MSKHRSGTGQALTLIDPGAGSVPGRADRPQENGAEEGELRRDERSLQMVAEELATALEHMERALLASKGTGFSGRVREAFEETDLLQREASREFGRKVGDRMGRSTLWRVQRGVDVD
jgi:hypothetical protein